MASPVLLAEKDGIAVWTIEDFFSDSECDFLVHHNGTILPFQMTLCQLQKLNILSFQMKLPKTLHSFALTHCQRCGGTLTLTGGAIDSLKTRCV
jgi:hypothetical protein